MPRGCPAGIRDHRVPCIYSAMQIYLIRHTPVNVPRGICYGQTDVLPAGTFEKDALQVKKDLNGYSPQVVYSSPARRCILLAHKLFDSKIITDDRLPELNFGDWEMRSWDAIRGEYAEQWMNDFINVKCPNGESFKKLITRVKSFYGELLQQQWDQVAIVTHSGVIRSFMVITGRIELKNAFSVDIPYGSVWQLQGNHDL